MNRARLLALLSNYGLSAVIGTAPENIVYATGYVPFQGVWNRFPKATLVSTHGNRPRLIVSSAEIGFVADEPNRDSYDVALFGADNYQFNAASLNADEAWIHRHLIDHRHPTVVDAVLHALNSEVEHGARIAVDETGAPELVDLLRARSSSYEFVPHGEDVWRLARMVKTPSEVEKLTRAVTVNEAAIAAVHARVGQLTERQLAAVFRDRVHEQGGAVQHWIGSSGRYAGAFRKPHAIVPERGSRWRFDSGVVVDCYCSDLGGTAQVGAQPSSAELHVYSAITAGVDSAVRLVRPGVRASDVYDAVLAAVRSAGLPDHHYSMVGHGIGIEPRDYPILAPPMNIVSPFIESPFDPRLEAGMVLNIEVPVNELGIGGFQHEVTLVIGETEARLLSARREYEVLEMA